MDVKLLLFTIGKFCVSVRENGSWKHPKVKWANFFSIDFYFTNIEVSSDISINLS